MTATAAGPAAPPVRPVPWRKLTWVSWRQHRLALGAAAALLAGVCLWMLISGLQMRSALASFGLNSCTPLTASSCSTQKAVFINDYYFGTQVVIGVLTVIPALIGTLIGGPLVARELETGTFRLSWTQGCGRTRWLAARVLLVGGLVTAAAAGVSVVFSWYYQPMLRLGQGSPLAPQIFDLRGVSFAGWTLAAFAISVCAGALIRRTIPAVVASMAAWSVLFVLAAFWLCSHHQAALTGVGLVSPASRFWHLQFIEGGWLLVLSILVGAATIWLIRHRAT